MGSEDTKEKQRTIFGKMFLLSNKLQVIGNQVFNAEMTITQWLATIAIAQFGNFPPTLGEVARLLGSSHQNIKQLALKLQKNGFVEIVRDKRDQRAIRLVLTKNSFTFWEVRQAEVKGFLDNIFKDFRREEIDLLYDSMSRMQEIFSKNREDSGYNLSEISKRDETC